MALITINNLHMRYRGPALFDGVNCRVDAGERIGLLGRNGAGKTTLMRLLKGEIEPDDGEVILETNARLAMLQQDVPTDISGSIADVVAKGVMEISDNESEWKSQNQVDQIMSRMELNGQLDFETLSSGMKRRVLLAQQLVANPDLLLLDEPTNHLDITAITWLEDFLNKWPGTFLFVTHDRTFLRKLATRILEIDRGHLFDWACDYDTFLVRKDAALEVEEKQNALFDKKLAQEEAWIRQGIKARRTRNEGRVRALEKLRLQHRERRAKSTTAKITIDEGQRSGQLVAQVNGVSFAYNDNVIVDQFSTMIVRGDKVGVIGPNGVGKTTLLRILLGELTPQSGTVRLGTNLDIAYFDQQRGKLNEDHSVEENVGDGYQSVTIGGKSKHIIGYLQDFLFSPERARTAIRFLSGGERNRVLLAKLFAKPANVLVLDEPTNDLDTETLELLEQRLVEYEGTVLLVSHDRTFLNNVVTSTIAFEDGNVREYSGGYDDWLRQRSDSTPAQKPESAKKPKRKQSSSKDQRKGLSYKQKQELMALPETIERLESEIAKLHKAMAQPEFYQKPGSEIATEQSKLSKFEDDLAQAYARWEELEQQDL